MLYEKKHILTTIELREIIMEAWVNGWQEDNTITNDNGKRAYSANAIGKLIDQENNPEGV